MIVSEELFTAKLQELETHYRFLLHCLRVCQQADRTSVHRELQNITKACQENREQLQQEMEQGRSLEVAALAQAQLRYCEETEEILNDVFSGKESRDPIDPKEQQVEALALYAEYAADFAVQAMRHALAAGLRAVDAQLAAKEKEDDFDPISQKLAWMDGELFSKEQEELKDE